MAQHEFASTVAYRHVDGSLPPRYFDSTAEGHVTYQKKAGHTGEEDDKVKIVTAEDSETSSIDEKYDVDSVHSSIAEEEHLT